MLATRASSSESKEVSASQRAPTTRPRAGVRLWVAWKIAKFSKLRIGSRRHLALLNIDLPVTIRGAWYTFHVFSRTYRKFRKTGCMDQSKPCIESSSRDRASC